MPNFAFAFGYTNSSWTLKVDLVCDHLCRLLAHMDPRLRHGDARRDDPTSSGGRSWTSQAGYVQRSVDLFPKQGSQGPWTVEMSYAADRARLRNGPVEDPALRFDTSSVAVREVAMPQLATA